MADEALTTSALAFIQKHFILIAVSSVIVRLLYRRYASPLRSIPGPFLASCSRAWKVWSTYGGHTEMDHIAVHNRYGPVVRIAPNEISFSSPQAAKDIFTVGKGFYKTDFYSVFPPPENPDIFTEVREWKHAQMKRFAVTPYSLASMQKLTPSIEEIERLLMQKLDEFVTDKPRECNLGNWLHYFAFDVLGEVAFSRRFGFLASGTDVEGQILAIDNVQWYDGIVGQLPWVDKFLRQNPIKPYLPFFNHGPTPMTRTALDELAKRKQGDNLEAGPEDLLGMLLRAHMSNPDKFSEGDVFAIAHGAIFAGSDSTASTMQSFFHHVLNDKQVYQELSAEIDEAQASGSLSEIVSYAEAQKLPFFQACLKEAMRVRPAVGLNISRHVPPSGTEIDGKFYPAGIRVAINAWVLHRDRGVFGADADIFRPQRWLEGNAKEMERHMYQFGGGGHLCIGRNLALLEMNMILPLLLREYRFQLVHPGRPIKYHSTFFVVQEGLEVFITKHR